MRRYFSAPVIVGILVILLLFSCGLVFLRTGMIVVHSPVDFHAPVIIMPNELTVTATPSSTNSPEFTATALPSTPISATPEQAATVTPTVPVVTLSRADIIKLACLDMSSKSHPNSGKPLIFKLNPYPQVAGDPETSWVGCEFEAYSAIEDLQFTLPRGTWMIGVDWYLGYQRDTTGVFTDLCASGPDCEGTFVLGSNDHDVVVTIVKGTLFHGYMYWDGQLTKMEFVGNGLDFSTSFACRYIWYDNKGHTNENIRPAIVPYVTFDHLLVNSEDISILGHLKNCPLTAP